MYGLSTLLEMHVKSVIFVCIGLASVGAAADVFAAKDLLHKRVEALTGAGGSASGSASGRLS